MNLYVQISQERKLQEVEMTFTENISRKVKRLQNLGQQTE